MHFTTTPDAARFAASGPTPERILRVAKTLLAHRGYEHTSTSSIAREAQVSEPQLIKRYGSKAGLLEAIFIDGWRNITMRARLAADNVYTPAEKLKTIIGVVVAALAEDPELKLLILLEGRRIRREGHMVALTDGFLEFVRLIDDVLGNMHETGMLRPGVDVLALRSALLGTLEGMLRDRFLADRLAFPAAYDLQQIPEMLALILRAASNGAIASAHTA